MKIINNINCYDCSIAEIHAGNTSDFYISMGLLEQAAKLFNVEIENIKPCLVLRTLFENQNEKNKVVLRGGRRKKEIKYNLLTFENIKIFVESEIKCTD